MKPFNLEGDALLQQIDLLLSEVLTTDDRVSLVLRAARREIYELRYELAEVEAERDALEAELAEARDD